MFGKHDGMPNPAAHAATLYQQGVAAYETGRFAEAIEKLSAIGDGRNLPATLARFYLGQSHLQQGHVDFTAGRYAEAASHFAEARRINPDSSGLSAYLTSCYLGQGRYDLATAEMEREIADGNREMTMPIRLAHAFARDGQFDRAIETLEAAIDVAPHQAELHYQLGVLHASADDYASATKSLKEAVRLAPLRSDIHRQLGLVHGALGQNDPAVRHLMTAQRLCPRDAHTALLLSMALQAAGATSPPAELTSTRPISTEQGNDLEMLGEVLVKDPDFVEAFLSLPASNVDPEIFSMLAATFEQALDRHPAYADLHYHCSRIYDRLGRTDDAIEKAQSAIEINPRYVQALIQLGRLYSQTNRDDEAERRLQLAIDSGGDYPDVHVMLGELYHRRGDRTRACMQFRRALQINANYTRAKAALEAALTA